MDLELDIELRPDHVRAEFVDNITQTTDIVSGPCWLYGWLLNNPSGVATTAGSLNTGTQELDPFFIGTNGNYRQILFDRGVFLPTGLRIVVTSGTIYGTVFVSYPAP